MKNKENARLSLAEIIYKKELLERANNNFNEN
jgi:hypothetical protein